MFRNTDGDYNGYGWKIVVNELNIDQQTTFKLYAAIYDNIVVSKLQYYNK